ncbi:MAG: hypothetical protein HXX14_18295 [Bacteroidetes bacterium]|nr:hypothetical protein [Bacteroidota bacterium]
MEKKALMNEILALLDKVDRQAKILTILPNMARIDVDLLLAQLRQVYDKAIDLQSCVEEGRHEQKTVSRPASTVQTHLPSPTPPVAKPHDPSLFQSVETPGRKPDVIIEIVQERPEISDVEEESPFVKPEVIIHPPSVLRTEPKPTHHAFSDPSPIPEPAKSLHQAFEEKTVDHSLASKLQYNPINDLRSAIGINDKFLMMNQLFTGSLEQYNSNIERLNNFHNFDDADAFLFQLKELHGWADDLTALEKLKHYVKRRYQKE